LAREGFPSHVQLAGSDGLNVGLTVGEQREAVAVPVVYEGLEVGSLELATVIARSRSEWRR
jgi:hypothetical protein